MTHPEVRRFLEHHRWRGSAEDLMAHRCTQLLEEAECTVPVDVRRLASFRGAVVEEADQDVAGWIGLQGGRLVIRVRRSDLESRRRFTVCHEVCHTFFPDFEESPRARTDPQVERFDRRDEVEYLCDLGAAELLLPRQAFSLLLPETFGIDHLVQLATLFRASVDATARRAVALSPQPVAAAALERTGAAGPYRVRWAHSRLLPTIRPHLQVPEGARLVREEAVEFRGPSGLLPGDLWVSARRLPYRTADREVDRVLVLLRP